MLIVDLNSDSKSIVESTMVAEGVSLDCVIRDS